MLTPARAVLCSRSAAALDIAASIPQPFSAAIMAHASGRVLVMLAVGMLFAAVAVSADEAGAVGDAPDFDLPGGVDVASFRDGRIRELEERLAARTCARNVDAVLPWVGWQGGGGGVRLPFAPRFCWAPACRVRILL